MQRADLPIEAVGTFDATGSYASDWVDSGNIEAVRLVWNFTGNSGPSVGIDQSSDATVLLGHNASGDATGRTFIAARYFRVSASNGQPGATVSVSVRAVSAE